MSSELKAVANVMHGVNKLVKPRQIKAGRKKPSGKGKDSKKEKQTKPATAKDKKESKSKPAEKKESSKSKAYQPMLPGMRGSVKRDTSGPSKRPVASKKETSKKPKAHQPMLPGMDGSKKEETFSPKSKREKEDKFIPGGTDWASMPPVNLSSPKKSK